MKADVGGIEVVIHYSVKNSLTNMINILQYKKNTYEHFSAQVTTVKLSSDKPPWQMLGKLSGDSSHEQLTSCRCDLQHTLLRMSPSFILDRQDSF